MSEKQRIDFAVPADTLTYVLSIVLVGTIVLAGVIFVMQIVAERVRIAKEWQKAEGRRLRYVKDNSFVILGPPILPTLRAAAFEATSPPTALSKHFHLFLSHVWSTGQDQMRVVRSFGWEPPLVLGGHTPNRWPCP